MIGAIVPMVAIGAVTSTTIVEADSITSVSISPNSDRVVVGTARSNTQTNKTELSWTIVPLESSSAPISVFSGEAIYDTTAPGALLNRPAYWSPDGAWFYYLHSDGVQIQIWRTRFDGGQSEQMTQSDADILDLRRAKDPTHLEALLGPKRASLRDAAQAEYASGILYDDHIPSWMPIGTKLPMGAGWVPVRRPDGGEWGPRGGAASRFVMFNMQTGKLEGEPVGGLQAPDYIEPEAPLGRFAVVRAERGQPNSADYFGLYTIRKLNLETKGHQQCTLKECLSRKIQVLGESKDGTSAYFVSEDAPGRDTIYEWNARLNRVRLVRRCNGRLHTLLEYSTPLLVPQTLVRNQAIVAFSSADEPVRLDAISLKDGQSKTLFDPNTEVRLRTHGKASWITWPTRSGYSGRGVLVLPNSYHRGSKYPLVITSYTCSRGFLRGGGADGPSEFVLAAHDFLAVCVDVPILEMFSKDRDRSHDYDVMFSILVDLLQHLDREGLVDLTRVGITGHSFGANAGAYAISRSQAFAAAAFRHGSAFEASSHELFSTSPDQRDPTKGTLAQMRLPDPRHDPEGRWDAFSVAKRAKEINAPTLLQLNDEEYLLALPLWSAMRDAGKAVEMHVFQDEPHVLTQPIHKLVNAERQVDWFRFWLKGEDEQSPGKASQYNRWRQLRAIKYGSAHLNPN